MSIEQNKKIKDWLYYLYNGTVKYLIDNNYDVRYAREFISDVSEYLTYMNSMGYNMDKIISKLSSIQYIGLFDENYIRETNKCKETDEVVPMMVGESSILLNNSIKGDSHLTEQERRKLYLFSALNHKVMSFKNLRTNEFSNMCLLEGYSKKNEKVRMLVNNGWLLLENVLAQDLAESIVYNRSHKVRPEFTMGLHGEKFPIENMNVFSNLEKHRVFSELVLFFGLTINNIATLENHDKNIIMHNLVKKAINDDLSDSIISEYISNKRAFQLYEMLYLMGLLVNEEYDKYNLKFIPNIKLDKCDVEIIYAALFTMFRDNMSFSDKKYHNAVIPHSKIYSLTRRDYRFFKYNEL